MGSRPLSRKWMNLSRISVASYSIANLLGLISISTWQDVHRMVRLPFDVSTDWEEVRPSLRRLP